MIVSNSVNVNWQSSPQEKIDSLGLEKIKLRHNPKNGLFVGTIHYSMNPTWNDERVIVEKKGLSRLRWERDMELKYHALGGELIFGCFEPEINIVEPFPIPSNWWRMRVI